MSTVKLTETKRVIIETECIENPVCLTWLGTLSWSTWVFSRQNTRLVLTAADGEFFKNESDLETAQGSATYLHKSASDSIVVGATVLKSSMDGLKGLIMSPKVLMLMNPDTWETDASGPVWQRVKIQPGSFIIERKTQTRNSIELVILLQETNLQSE